MTAQRALFLVAAAILGLCLTIGVLGLPGPATADQPYAQALAQQAVTQRALNTVSGVLFDLRALDTLGEALALFAAASGLQLALRGLPGEVRLEQPRGSAPDRDAPGTSDAVRAVALAAVPLTAALAVLVTLRGHLGVGGGLQGGGLGAAALATLFLAGHYRAQRRVAQDEHLDIEEALGAGGYAAFGIVGLLAAGALLANVLPLGSPGELLSSGAVLFLSVLVALEARAALLVIVGEVQEEPLEREVRP